MNKLQMVYALYSALLQDRQWSGRGSVEGFAMLCGMRDHIAKQTGVEAQDVYNAAFSGWAFGMMGANVEDVPESYQQAQENAYESAMQAAFEARLAPEVTP